MADSIGSASVQIGTDAAKLNTGLDTAQKKIGEWADKTSKQMASKMGGGGSAASANPYVAVAMAIGSALQSAVDNFVAYWKAAVAGIREVAAEAKIAESLGMGFEKFQGIMFGLKTDAQGAASILSHLGQTLSQARSGGSRGARRAEQQLGGLGFDRNQIRQLGTQEAGEAFGQIAERIRQIQNPMERLAAAERIFGEHGREALRAINGGFAENIANAERLGLVISNEDTESIRSAQGAMAQMGQIGNGIFRQMIAAVAPFVSAIRSWGLMLFEFIAPGIRAVVDLIKGVGQAFLAFSETLAEMGRETGIGELFSQWKIDIPVIKSFVLGFAQGFLAAAAAMIDWSIRLGADFSQYCVAPMLRGIAGLLEGFAGFIDGLNRDVLTPFLAILRRIIEGMRSVAGLDPTGTLTAQLDTALNGLNSVNSAVGNLGQNIRADAARLQGWANTAVDAAGIARQLAVVGDSVDGFFARVRARADRATADGGLLPGLDMALQRAATDIHNRFANPMETLADSMAQIQRLSDEGLISTREYGAAMNDALRTAERSLNIGPAKLSQLAFRGSVEATRTIYHRDVDNKPNDPQERLRQLQERNNQMQAQQVDIGRAMLDLMRNRPEAEVI